MANDVSPGHNENTLADALFRRLDTDGNGELDVNELASFLCSLRTATGTKDGFDDVAAAQGLIGRWSQHGHPDTINLADFRTLYGNARSVFDDIDTAHNGRLSVKEVHDALRQQRGMKRITMAEVQHMIDRFDMDGSGELSFSEFLLLYDNAFSQKATDVLSFWASATSGPTDVGTVGSPLSLGKDLVTSGFVAGLVAKTTTYPLSRLTMVLQTRPLDDPSLSRRGTLAWARYIVKRSGWGALWKGAGLGVARMGPATAINLASYESAKRWLNSSAGHMYAVQAMPTMLRDALAGGCAAASSVTLTYPLDVLRTRVATDVSRHGKSVASVYSSILRRESLLGLYRGFGVALLEVAPSVALNFALYDQFRSFCEDSWNWNRTATFSVIATSCAASLVSSTATYPMLFVRRNMQAAHGSKAATAQHVITSTLRQYGARGFFRGIGPFYAQILPQCAISFTVFERCKGYLRSSLFQGDGGSVS